jgi:hypothetical protein
MRLRNGNGARKGCRRVLACLAALLIVTSGVASAQELTEIAKLKALDAGGGDAFAASVALSDATAVVGAFGDDDRGANAGAAYVFTRTNGIWTQQQKLVAADGAADDRLGQAVAIAGDTAVISAINDDDRGSNSGSVHVFTRANGVWTLQAKLTAADGAANDGFGQSVAISGDTIVIGAARDDDAGTDAGSAYVFTRAGSVWTQQQKLIASDGAAGDFFGFAAAISGDTIIAGASQDDAPSVNAGSAYLFTRTNGVWSPGPKLTASDAAAEDLFGVTVAIDGDTAAVGAVQDDDLGTNSGSVYVFTRAFGQWSFEEKLVAPDGGPVDSFGGSVAVAGDFLVAGAYGDDDLGTDAGSAYLFARFNGVWMLHTKLMAADGGTLDFFGRPVAISGDVVLVGAFLDDDRAPDSGAAYVFGYSDSDHDGVYDTGDLCSATPTGATVTNFGCALADLVGPQGPAGLNGLDGTAGPAGVDGVSIVASEEMPGANCAAGGQRLVPNYSNGSPAGPPSYICHGMRGPQGEAGAAGATGADGAQGPQGEPGPVGPQGPEGPQGLQGPAGPQGPAGMQVAGSLLLMVEGVPPPPGYLLVGTFVEERIDADGRGGERPRRLRVVLWQKQ